MAVTIHSPFRSAPRISRSGFIAVLERQGSFEADALWGPFPRNARPDVAHQCYDIIAEAGHDPAVHLAILGKESSFGTNQNSVLWRNNTRSYSNARTIRHPDVLGEIITDSYRRSNYVRYQDIRDSFRDGVYRVDDPTFAYQQAGATTIAEVIAIWAPADDQNDPAGYSRTMVDWINQWAAEFPPDQEETDMSTVNGVPFRVDHIPRSNGNRPGHAMTPQFITVHETGNPRGGANAEMHRRWMQDGTDGSTGWHITVDDSEAIEHIPRNENAWHAGDGGSGTGNRQSVGVELCVNVDGNWGRTILHGAKVVAWLLGEHGLLQERIVQHNHWSGKNCPETLRGSNGAGWRDLLTMVASELKGNGPNPGGSSNHYHDEFTDKWVVDLDDPDYGLIPMFSYWDSAGRVSDDETSPGRPITGMVLEHNDYGRGEVPVFAQLFENVRLEILPRGYDGKSELVQRYGAIGARYKAVISA